MREYPAKNRSPAAARPGTPRRYSNLLGRESERAEIFDRLREPGRQEVSPVRRHVAYEQFERAPTGEAGSLVSGHHRELIQVGSERALHKDTPPAGSPIPRQLDRADGI